MSMTAPSQLHLDLIMYPHLVKVCLHLVGLDSIGCHVTPSYHPSTGLVGAISNERPPNSVNRNDDTDKSNANGQR